MSTAIHDSPNAGNASTSSDAPIPDQPRLRICDVAPSQDLVIDHQTPPRAAQSQILASARGLCDRPGHPVLVQLRLHAASETPPHPIAAVTTNAPPPHRAGDRSPPRVGAAHAAGAVRIPRG